MQNQRELEMLASFCGRMEEASPDEMLCVCDPVCLDLQLGAKGVQAVQGNACALFHGKGTGKNSFRNHRLLLACVMITLTVLSLSLGPEGS